MEHSYLNNLKANLLTLTFPIKSPMADQYYYSATLVVVELFPTPFVRNVATYCMKIL